MMHRAVQAFALRVNDRHNIHDMQLELEPFDLARTSLTFSAGRWRVPKSNTTVLFCFVAGTFGRAASVEDDLRFIRYRVEEADNLAGDLSAIVVDLSGMEIAPEAVMPALEAIIAPEVRRRNEAVRLIINEGLRTVAGEAFAPEEIAASAQAAAAELAYLLRKRRHDGGAQMAGPPDYPPPVIEPVAFGISDVIAEYFTWHSANGARNGYIRFAGTYRHGSAGDDDARVIRWRLNEFFETIDPRALVVDVRDLEYEFGDDLNLHPRMLPMPGRHVRYVLAPEQLESYSYVIPRKEMSFSSESAFAELNALL